MVLFIVLFYIVMGLGSFVLGFIIWDKDWGYKDK